MNEHALFVQAGVALATAVVHVWHASAVPHAATVVPGAQLPPEQHPVPHDVLHTPQLWGSVRRFTQAPPHSVKPVSHAKPQVPPLHTGDAFATLVVQGLLHDPQFERLVITSAQPLEHIVGVCAGQVAMHVDPEQTGVPDGHACPQLAQSSALFARSTHAPLHGENPLLHVKPHRPPLQEAVALATVVVQGLAQPPSVPPPSEPPVDESSPPPSSLGESAVSLESPASSAPSSPASEPPRVSSPDGASLEEYAGASPVASSPVTIRVPVPPSSKPPVAPVSLPAAHPADSAADSNTAPSSRRSRRRTFMLQSSPRAP
jgi:hypothetical protein